MRPWPPFPRTISVTDAIEPLLRVINTRDPERYDGYDIGVTEKQSCCEPDFFLRAAGQGGRLDTLRARVLFVAFWLGMEQGRRVNPTSVPWEMSRPSDCQLLMMSAGRRYLEVTGWKANEWTPWGKGPQRYIEKGWTAPEGGPPMTYLEALREAFASIGRGKSERAKKKARALSRHRWQTRSAEQGRHGGCRLDRVSERISMAGYQNLARPFQSRLRH